MKRTAITSLAESAALAGTVLGVGIAALAANEATRADCSGNLTCTYDGRNYQIFLGSQAPGVALQNISTGNRNTLSSWINYTNTGARFYYGTDGNGTCVSMAAKNRATATGTNPDDNQAESCSFTRTW